MFGFTLVDAIMRIKSTYGVKKNWLGDPCAPLNYPWKDLNCSYVDNESPIIVSVYEISTNVYLCFLLSFSVLSQEFVWFCRNLSFSALTGQIDPAFSNLTSLQKLSVFFL